MTILQHWYDALHHPLGIWLRTSEPVALKTALYNVRQRAQDPALLDLTIRTSPIDPNGEVWIMHLPPAED